jgi:hypothetical protein
VIYRQRLPPFRRAGAHLIPRAPDIAEHGELLPVKRRKNCGGLRRADVLPGVLVSATCGHWRGPVAACTGTGSASDHGPVLLPAPRPLPCSHGVSTQLLEILREAIGVISRRATPAFVGVTGDGATYVTVIGATLPSAAAAADCSGAEYASLRDRAALAGIPVEIEPGPDCIRVAWHVPVT